MITWVTVWILTSTQVERGYSGVTKSHYQLQYATKDTCEKQKRYHNNSRCDFQQIPMVIK